MSYTDHDGKVHEDARAFDPAKDHIEISKGGEKEILDLKSFFKTQQFSVFDLSLRKFTQSWCKVSATGNIPQFSNRTDTFFARGELIGEAQVYRFKNEQVKWLIENNSNQHGYRYMPNENIWVECLLEKDGVTVNGIHILKVKAKKDSEDHTFYMSLHGVPDMEEETEDAISIFYTGFDTSGATFYQLSLLDRKDMWKRAKKYHYACPYCNSPMENITKNEIACKNERCLKNNQKGSLVIYDLSNPVAKSLLDMMDMSDVWKVEDYVKTFVCNFLDFMTVKEVSVRVLMDSAERHRRNEKRTKRGQEPLSDMRIIEVTGHLYRYVNLLQERIGAGNKLEYQQAVSGHFFRFWSRDKWHK
ncbi:hypothetical protein MUP79_05510, partial [Candidatus Bathyarchaeota archaeon]|nr:hypothetical protein [Candidatus Bathyarchaeota archaeon]